MMHAPKPTIGRITTIPRDGMTNDETHGYLKQVVKELIVKGCTTQIFGAAAFRRRDYLPNIITPRIGQVMFSPGPPRNQTMMRTMRTRDSWTLTQLGEEIRDTLGLIKPDCVIIDPMEIWIPALSGKSKAMLIGAMYGWWHGLADYHGFAVVMVRK